MTVLLLLALVLAGIFYFMYRDADEPPVTETLTEVQTTIVTETEEPMTATEIEPALPRISIPSEGPSVGLNAEALLDGLLGGGGDGAGVGAVAGEPPKFLIQLVNNLTNN